MSQVKVLLVDDHQMVTQGLKMVLDMDKSILVVANVQNGKEAVDYVANHHVDLIVMDVNMPEMDGREASRIIKSKYPHIKIIVLTTYNQRSLIHELVEIKVDGCMLKDNSVSSLVKAIHRVMGDKSYFDDISDFNAENKEVKLSKREADVLRKYCNDSTAQEIANELDLSALTVRTHLKNIRKKLDIHERSALVQYAMNQGLI